MMNRVGQIADGLRSMDYQDRLRAITGVIARFIPLRQRYYLTRHNRLRLRYVALPCAGFAALVLMGGTMASGGFFANDTRGAGHNQPVILGPDAQMAASDQDDQSIFARLAASQKRLTRPSAAEDGAEGDGEEAARLAMIDPAAGVPTTRLENGNAASAPQEKSLKIGSGDTLTGVLSRAGLSNNEAYEVVKAVREHVDPRHLKPGQVLNIKMEPTANREGGYQFASLNLAVDPLRTVSVARGEAEKGYQAELQERETHTRVYAQEAAVQNSLFGSAAKAGIPSSVVAEAIRVYSWQVDFQRDIRQGDKLKVLYEQKETEDGVRIKTGNLLYAQLTLEGIDIPVYRFEMKDGRVDYFQRNGSSIRKTLMKTPIDGARVSSGYGMRRHPIQGYSRMHKGIDFAAPTGTPIYAAGDGTVQRAGRNGGYGNYIRIRHNGQISTAYAHMSRIAKGIVSGARVRQGDVIGYVGSTGASTGPHLHYEILVNGAHVNPRGVNLPTGEMLEGDQLRLFQAKVRQIDQDFSRRHSLKYAQNTR